MKISPKATIHSLVTFALLVLPALCQADQLAVQGRELFRKHCSSCHGSLGLGDGPASSALQTKPANLTTIQKRNGGAFPQREVTDAIDGRSNLPAHGSSDMPVWGRKFGSSVTVPSVKEEVTRGNILALIRYLQSIQQ